MKGEKMTKPEYLNPKEARSLTAEYTEYAKKGKVGDCP